MRRRTVLKGIGTTGLLAATGATPGLAAEMDAPAGGDLYLRFDDDRETLAVDPDDVAFGPDEILVEVDGSEFSVDPFCSGCCAPCDDSLCGTCLCFWCPPDQLQ